MQTEQLIITVFAADRPGIVRALSDAVLNNQGNWLESSLSRLCGQFAGIVHLSIPAASKANLLAELTELLDKGIQVTVHSDVAPVEQNSQTEQLDIVVEANDRPGIVDEIASALSAANVNVEQMETECVSASMAGYELFRAYLGVNLPDDFTVEQLETLLEDVSDDLTVSIVTGD